MLVVENHWLSESVRGKQKLALHVFELLVEGKQIWIWRMLFLSAGRLEMVSGCCVALVYGTLCGWVFHYLKESAVSVELMENGLRSCNVPVD